MSPKLPVVSGKETARALERVGFAQVRQRGSHLKLRRSDGRTVIVPLQRAGHQGRSARYCAKQISTWTNSSGCCSWAC